MTGARFNDRVGGEVAAILALAAGLPEPLEESIGFFDAGGTSITAMLAAATLRSALDVPVTLRDVLANPAPARLAEVLRQRIPAARPPVSASPLRCAVILPNPADAGSLRFMDKDLAAKVRPFVLPNPHCPGRGGALISELAALHREQLAGQDEIEVVVGYAEGAPIAYELAATLHGGSGGGPRALLIGPIAEPPVKAAPLAAVLATRRSPEWLLENGVYEMIPENLRLEGPEPTVLLDEPDALLDVIRPIVDEYAAALLGLDRVSLSEASLASVSESYFDFLTTASAARRHRLEPTTAPVSIAVDDEAQAESWSGLLPSAHIALLPSRGGGLLRNPDTWRLAL